MKILIISWFIGLIIVSLLACFEDFYTTREKVKLVCEVMLFVAVIEIVAYLIAGGI